MKRQHLLPICFARKAIELSPLPAPCHATLVAILDEHQAEVLDVALRARSTAGVLDRLRAAQPASTAFRARVYALLREMPPVERTTEEGYKHAFTGLGLYGIGFVQESAAPRVRSGRLRRALDLVHRGHRIWVRMAQGHPYFDVLEERVEPEVFDAALERCVFADDLVLTYFYAIERGGAAAREERLAELVAEIAQIAPEYRANMRSLTVQASKPDPPAGSPQFMLLDCRPRFDGPPVTIEQMSMFYVPPKRRKRRT